jgi:GNAT superfamily N-acetyltransferase
LSDIDLWLNPQGIRSQYLAALNRCFGHWGDESTYGWAFEREVDAPRADLFVLHRAGELIAGSAVTYRRARMHGGGEFIAGVMTGSWTLPSGRGQGCFSRVIDESVRIARSRGAGVLLAFVTEDNASRRRLLAAGCVSSASSYIFSTPDTALPSGPVIDPEPLGGATLWPEVMSRHHALQAGATHFVYSSPRAWAGQFLERPSPVEILDVGQTWCVIEDDGHSDRVLLMLEPPGEGSSSADVVRSLLVRAQRRNRQLFLFTLNDRPTLKAATSAGLVIKPGLLTALLADSDRLAEASGALIPGGGSDLEQLAPWALQSGDRM